MITAENIGRVNPDAHGHQILHRLSERVAYNRSWDPDEPDLVEFDHIVTSAASVPYSGPETYVFAATPGGVIKCWTELPGSFRGDLDHDRALVGFLAAANDAPDRVITY